MVFCSRFNYARYLSIHLTQIANLDDPMYYQCFLNGGFSIQRSNTNPFGRIPIDQVIEETVNKDTQTARGTRNFSLRRGTVSWYYLTAEFRAVALTELRNMTYLNSEQLQHPDLYPRRTRKDVTCVNNMVELLVNGWTNPFELNGPDDILNLSSGISAPKNIRENPFNVKKKGEEACSEFRGRIQEGIDFYKPIKKLKIRTFSDVKNSKSAKKEDTVLKADRHLFANITLIAESRQINMQEIFSYPLGPFPWSLANIDGSIRKNDKATLGTHLEKNIYVSESLISAASVVVIDGMSVVQKLRGENLTFEEFSMTLLKKIFVDSKYERVDLVFDVYVEKSIKALERKRRGETEGIQFQNIRPAHKIVNWRRLLRSSDFKNKFTKYLVDSWKEETFKTIFCASTSKVLFVTYGQQCLKFSYTGFEEISHFSVAIKSRRSGHEDDASHQTCQP